jgi:MarR family transcriptional regulator for hemolysin
MEKLEELIFYKLEKAIKSYRQLAQSALKQKGYVITIDQWLILKLLNDNPDIQQIDLASLVFKDNASVTRIIDLLVKKNYILRSNHLSDKRRSMLKITPLGKRKIDQLTSDVKEYRKDALIHITKKEITQANIILDKIISNCNKK